VAGKEMKQTYEPDGHGTEAATQQAVELLLSILEQVQKAASAPPFTTTQDEEAKRNASFAAAAFSIVDRALAFLPAGVTFDAISPSSGPAGGGTQVKISGSNFIPGATLSFGDLAATNVTVVSTTEIEAKTPASNATGAVDVTVTSFGGETRRTGAYTYK
jgi:hypothetical protein